MFLLTLKYFLAINTTRVNNEFYILILRRQLRNPHIVGRVRVLLWCKHLLPEVLNRFPPIRYSQVLVAEAKLVGRILIRNYRKNSKSAMISLQRQTKKLYIFDDSPIRLLILFVLSFTLRFRCIQYLLKNRNIDNLLF